MEKTISLLLIIIILQTQFCAYADTVEENKPIICSNDININNPVCNSIVITRKEIPLKSSLKKGYISGDEYKAYATKITNNYNKPLELKNIKGIMNAQKHISDLQKQRRDNIYGLALTGVFLPVATPFIIATSPFLGAGFGFIAGAFYYSYEVEKNSENGKKNENKNILVPILVGVTLGTIATPIVTSVGLPLTCVYIPLRLSASPFLYFINNSRDKKAIEEAKIFSDDFKAVTLNPGESLEMTTLQYFGELDFTFSDKENSTKYLIHK
jgi:hypothetical protein